MEVIRPQNVNQVIHSLLSNAAKTELTKDSIGIPENITSNLASIIHLAPYNALVLTFKTFIYFLKNLQPQQEHLPPIYQPLFKIFTENLLIFKRNIPLQVLQKFQLVFTEFSHVLESFQPLKNHPEHVQLFWLQLYFNWLQLHSLAKHYNQHFDNDNVISLSKDVIDLKSSKLQKEVLKLFIFQNRLQNDDQLNDNFSLLINDNVIITEYFLKNYFTKLSEDNQKILSKHILDLKLYNFDLIESCPLFNTSCLLVIVEKIHHFLVNDLNLSKKSKTVKVYNFYFLQQNIDFDQIFVKSSKSCEIGTKSSKLMSEIDNLKYFLFFETNDAILESVFGYILAICFDTNCDYLKSFLCDFLKFHSRKSALLTQRVRFEVYLKSVTRNVSYLGVFKGLIDVLLEDHESFEESQQFLEGVFREIITGSDSKSFAKVMLMVYDDDRVRRSGPLVSMLHEYFIELIQNDDCVDFVKVALLAIVMQFDQQCIGLEEYRKYFDFLKSNLNTPTEIDTCLKLLIVFTGLHPDSEYRDDILNILQTIVSSGNFETYSLLTQILQTLPYSDQKILLNSVLKPNEIQSHFHIWNAIVCIFRDCDYHHDVIIQILNHIGANFQSDVDTYLNFVRFLMFNKKITLKSTEIDKIMEILFEAIRSPEQVEYMHRSLRLLSDLFQQKFDLLTDKLPVITLMIRMSLKTLSLVTDTMSNDNDFENVQNCVFQIEKITYRFVNFERHFRRISAYLVADFLNFYVTFSKWPPLKLHLGNSINNLLRICDEHAMKFLRKSLGQNRIVLLDKFVGETTKRKFSGKI